MSHHYVCLFYKAFQRIQVVGRKLEVCSRCHTDAVLSVGFKGNKAATRTSVARAFDVLRVKTFFGKCLYKVVTENVVTYTSHHRHVCSHALCRNSLICAFATEVDIKLFAVQCFACLGCAFAQRDKVCYKTAYYKYAHLCSSSILPSAPPG